MYLTLEFEQPEGNVRGGACLERHCSKNEYVVLLRKGIVDGMLYRQVLRKGLSTH
jgi:hypothetical protein